MRITRKIIVLDAADLEAESSFWSALLGGKAEPEDDWRTTRMARSYLGIQLAPDHVLPKWPEAPQQQQIHLDLYVEDVAAAHEEALALGARLLQPASEINAAEGFRCTPTRPVTLLPLLGLRRRVTRTPARLEPSLARRMQHCPPPGPSLAV